MSYSRFGYHTLSLGGAELTGYFVGGPVGVLVGASMMGYEALYDHIVVPLHDFFFNIGNSFQNPRNFGAFFGY